MVKWYVLIWAIIMSGFCAIPFHLMLKKTSFLVRNGLTFFLLGCIMSLVRLLAPLEFSRFQHKMEYPSFISSLLRERLLFHNRIPTGYFLLILSLAVSLILLCLAYISSRIIIYKLEHKHYEDENDNLTLSTIDKDCPLSVRRTTLLKVPYLIGLRKPEIYIPDEDYSQEELHNLLLHEYNHWRYHHAYVRAILLFINILLWWNPVIFLLRADGNHLLEIICDDLSTRQYDSNEKVGYLATLLRCMQDTSKPVSQFPLYKGYACGFLHPKKGSHNQQRVLYQLNRDINGAPPRRRIYALYSLTLLGLIVSYYVIMQPSYAPAEVNFISNENNAYLVESPNGAYNFYYDSYVVPVSQEEVQDGLYSIYTIIQYDDYKNLDSYKDSKKYKRYLSQYNRWKNNVQ